VPGRKRQPQAPWTGGPLRMFIRSFGRPCALSAPRRRYWRSVSPRRAGKS
jgi:hypothetical protein